MIKTGLFFGSFNPVHVGHLIVAEFCATQTDLEEVWLVVSPQNPLKATQELAPAHVRLEMVFKAVEGNARLRVCDIEHHLPLPSYTADTLKALSSQYPDREFTLIVGEDIAYSFHRWKDYEWILSNYRLMLYPRTADSTGSIDVLQGRGNVQRVSAPKIELSATYVRTLVSQGMSAKYVVPDVVLEVIQQHKLYL
jgi:nicotinate-nucleotide adenylyltransferase